MQKDESDTKRERESVSDTERERERENVSDTERERNRLAAQTEHKITGR